MTSLRQIKPRRSSQPSICLLLSANRNRLPRVFIPGVPVFSKFIQLVRKMQPEPLLFASPVYPPVTLILITASNYEKFYTYLFQLMTLLFVTQGLRNESETSLLS